MGVEVSRLSNGMTVATETLPHVESVALGVWVKSGARNERDDEHGIAHLLEHMAFKGTKRRSAFEIASEIEDVGGEINAATSVETTSFYARVLSDDVPLAVDMLADILQESEFDPQELEREHGLARERPNPPVEGQQPSEARTRLGDGGEQPQGKCPDPGGKECCGHRSVRESLRHVTLFRAFGVAHENLNPLGVYGHDSPPLRK